MKIIDINPETKALTEAIAECSIRILYKNNTHYDYKVNQGDEYHGDDRANHPYIKNYLGNIKVNEVQQILILNKDGTERFGPIEIPSGKLPAFRLRTFGGSSKGVNRYLVIGIVDKTSQILHFIYRDGSHVESTSPPPLGPVGKIGLLEEELKRL